MANDDLSVLARYLYDETKGLSYVCIEDMITYYEKQRDYLKERILDPGRDKIEVAHLRGAQETFTILASDLEKALYSD